MKRKPIPLSKDLDQLLRRRYKAWRIPRGQFKKHPEYLEAFTSQFNEMAGTNYSSTEIYHYIETQQKITARLDEPWPTFDGGHKVLPSVADVFTSAHIEALRSIWRRLIVPLGLGTDAVAYRDDLLDLLSKEFRKATSLRVPGMMLAAKAEHERKKGMWVCLRDEAAGFTDLDMIG